MKVHFLSLKGGALYFAIVVILLTSMIALGFILLGRLWFQEDVQVLKITQLNDNLDSAEQWLMMQPNIVKPGETKELDLYGDSSYVKVETQKWGLLRLVKTSAEWRNIQINRTRLFSELKNKQYALYLTDLNKFLSLTGKCIITGNCSLPALGLRSGEMDGGTFIGKQMIDGEIYQSGKKLPSLSAELLKPWKYYLDKKFRKNDSIVSINLVQNPVISASFNSPTLVLDCGKKTILQNTSLKGNIIICASDTIQVDPTAVLKDVILIAGTIIVSDNTQGVFQLFARNEISFGKNCRLRFPSFAVCLSGKSPGKITIDKNSIVNGGILIESSSETKGSNRLEMSEGNKILGTVWVNGDVGFAGQIDGSIYCNKFFIETPRAYYENFLRDAVINSESIPAKFGSFVIDGSPDKLKKAGTCL